MERFYSARAALFLFGYGLLTIACIGCGVSSSDGMASASNTPSREAKTFAQSPFWLFKVLHILTLDLGLAGGLVAEPRRMSR